MKLSKEHISSIVKQQTINWLLAILFTSGYALFAKLIWTAKFPILIFLPLLMMGFAIGSINSIRSTLLQFVDEDA